MEKITLWLPADLAEWARHRADSSGLYQQEIGRVAYENLRDIWERAPEEAITRLIEVIKERRAEETPSERQATSRPRKPSATPRARKAKAPPPEE